MDLPMVTVVMPVRNEARSIERSLGAVLDQDYPNDLLEVLVVDGMSEDDTQAIVRRLSEGSRKPINILTNERRTVPSAMNIAIAQAHGDVIVRVDGHCEIASDYVRRCVEILAATGADNVGGLQNAVGSGPIGTAIAGATSARFGVGGARFHYAREGRWTDTVYLGAYPREVFDRIGGYDEGLVRNQDDELNLRLSQSGGKIWLDPSIRSVYHARESLSSLWKQYFQYGVYKVRVMQKRGEVARLSHVVPAAFVVALFAAGVTSVFTRRPIFVALVAVPYVVATVVSSIAVAGKDVALLALLPPTFATMHFAYGLGTLAGLWRWRRSWGKT